MEYRQRVGVITSVPRSKSLDGCLLTNVMFADLQEVAPRRTEVDGTPILIYRHEGTIYAMGAVCSHAGGQLDEGDFDGTCVQSPWNQSGLDLRDGSVDHGPATVKDPPFHVRINTSRVHM